MGINYTETQENLVIIVSALSAFFSIPFCFSYVIFYAELSKKISYEILFYFFISNFFTSIGSVVGLPDETNLACWWEGIMTNIFTLSAINWITVLSAFLLFIIADKKKYLHLNFIYHFVCWGIPVIFTFLPLINSTYGPPDGEGWCWVVDNETTPEWGAELWYWLSFYLWVWLSFILIIIFGSLSIYSYSLIRKHTKNNKHIISVFQKFIGYPIIILITWGPSTVQDYISMNTDLGVNSDFRFISTLLSTAMGFICAILFFSKDDTIIKNWKILYACSFDTQEYKRYKREVSSTISLSSISNISISVRK